VGFSSDYKTQLNNSVFGFRFGVVAQKRCVIEFETENKRRSEPAKKGECVDAGSLIRVELQ